MKRPKSSIYSEEQNEICNRLFNILNLDEENSITLYELDNNIEMQNKILDLIPEIKKYYKCAGVIAINNPDKCKRKYMSILKFILKKKYKIYTCDIRIKISNNVIRTSKYIISNA